MLCCHARAAKGLGGGVFGKERDTLMNEMNMELVA
jgi:hypothetical protein